MIGVDCHGFTPIVGRALGTKLVVCGGPKEEKMESSGVPKEAKIEPSRGPKEAKMQPKSLLWPSGEFVFCLPWRLEGS